MPSRLLKLYLHRNVDLMAVYQGLDPSLGPRHVQIDLTDHCNNDCIACWCNSPLLKKKPSGAEPTKATLDYDVAIRLIDDLARLGTSELYFAGGGEPFMHPRLLDVVGHAKAKGMRCAINTNFTLVDDKALERLVEMGVDSLVLSFWAGTARTYSQTHPNKNEADFADMSRRLTLLAGLKRYKPVITLYNVISNLNYFEIEEMYRFACQSGADEIEFAPVDVLPGQTDGLLLSPDQSDYLERAFRSLLERHPQPLRQNSVLREGQYALFSRRPAPRQTFIREAQTFLRRISTEASREGDYDAGHVEQLACYAGFIFSRVLANGDVIPCLKAHRLPVGNIYDQPFEAIWRGQAQRRFREAGLSDRADHPIFGLIGNDDSLEFGCRRGCDDLARNEDVACRLKGYGPARRALFRMAANAFDERPGFRRWLTGA